MTEIEGVLGNMVKEYPWAYAIVLLLVSKFVNSRAAALAAIVPVALAIGVDPAYIVASAPACYGYYILPTYPSDWRLFSLTALAPPTSAASLSTTASFCLV